MSDHEKNVSDQTRAIEAEDEYVTAGADRDPTAEEQAAADRVSDLDPEVAEQYRRQAKVGAEIEGEGQIS